uniref:Uncharacterized protein n=1 Tax=Anguilla anguilla TaxID=7936 RepID=A0A0E9WQW7_ANGAN
MVTLQWRWTRKRGTRWDTSRTATDRTAGPSWATCSRWCVTSSRRSTPITARLDKPPPSPPLMLPGYSGKKTTVVQQLQTLLGHSRLLTKQPFCLL